MVFHIEEAGVAEDAVSYKLCSRYMPYSLEYKITRKLSYFLCSMAINLIKGPPVENTGNLYKRKYVITFL